MPRLDGRVSERIWLHLYLPAANALARGDGFVYRRDLEGGRALETARLRTAVDSFDQFFKRTQYDRIGANDLALSVYQHLIDQSYGVMAPRTFPPTSSPCRPAAQGAPMRPVGTASPVVPRSFPKLDPVTLAGRHALRAHLSDVLFNPKNPAGAKFREACLDWRTPADQARFKAQMLREAAAWTPAAPGWQKSASAGKTVFYGELSQLYTEVRFNGGKPEVYVEID